ncbi:response regulator [Candidatus Riflebacteria bacterium]
MVYDPNKYVSTSQAAKICSVSRVTVHNWIKSGKLGALKLPGGQLKINRTDLDQFIFSNYTVLNTVTEKAEKIEVSKKILVIDDDKRHCELLKTYFSDFLEVRIHNSVLSAVEGLARFKPDVVFLDIRMPDVNGDALVKFLKQSEDYRKIPLILISAFPETEARKRIKTIPEQSSIDFFQKPLRLDALRKFVLGKLKILEVGSRS